MGLLSFFRNILGIPKDRLEIEKLKFEYYGFLLLILYILFLIILAFLSNSRSAWDN